MTDPSALDEAEARVAEARSQLGDTLGAIQHRLDPRIVVRGAVDGIAEGSEKALRSGASAARRNPGKIIGALALAAALLTRRRIAAAIGKAGSADDESAQPAPARRVRSSKPRPAPARRKQP